MDSLLFGQNDREELARLGIEALVLFGSRAMGNALAMSDYDIGVLVKNPRDNVVPERRKIIYDTLYDFLSARINKLVNIDIVFLENAPAELQMHVSKHGRALFEATPAAFARFKERVALLYSDFAPFRELFHATILKRISS